MPPTGFEDGGNCWWKICLNQRNRRLKALFSHYSQVLTRVERGGIGGPNTPAGALGSPVNFSPNLSDKNSNFTTRAGFTITFAWTVRADECFNNSLETGTEILNNFRRKIRRFQPVTQLRETLWVWSLWRKNWLAEEGGDAPSKVSLRLPIAKTFYTRRTALVERLLPRQQVVFMTDF